MIPTAAVAEAHQRLYGFLAGLTDEQVRAPSPLPGWTRGHVLAHVTDAGRALADLVEQALRGKLVPLYDPATHDRDGIIEATAARTADEHRAALREHSDRLEAAWACVEDWAQPVTYRVPGGSSRPKRSRVLGSVSATKVPFASPDALKVPFTALCPEPLP